MKRETIAVLVSIVALLVSTASLFSSCEVQRHHRMVAFEQRKQEVRRVFLESQVLLQRVSDACRDGLGEESDPEIREAWANILELSIGQREDLEAGLRAFGKIGPVGDTEAQLLIEELNTDATTLKREIESNLERIAEIRSTF